MGKLSEIAYIEMGISPEGSSCNILGQGIPLLNGPTEFGSHHPIPVQYSTTFRKKSQKNDLLFCVRGSTTGRMNWSDQEYVIGRGICAIRHQNGKDYQPFLKAVIDFNLSNLLAQATGSTFPNVSKPQIENIEITIPPLPTQKAIAHILGTLDDKIELLRSMNETLESMARSLFKSWFIDFDPIRKKSEGIATGLPTEIDALFPDSFENSELGEIPTGWSVGYIKDCCEFVQNGGTPRRDKIEYWNPSTIPWLTSGEVRQSIIIHTNQCISDSGLKNSSAKWIPCEATVVALYGATAGQVSYIGMPLTTNQAICSLIPITGFQYFNYIHMSNNIANLLNQARGSAQQNISKGIVELTKLVIPTKAIVIYFSQIVSPHFNNWIQNLYEKTHLENLRDSLLPKLISGELELTDPMIKKILENQK